MKYNHAFDIAFTVVTENEGDKVTGAEMLRGIRERVASLIDEDPTLEVFVEACGLPFDTYEEED